MAKPTGAAKSARVRRGEPPSALARGTPGDVPCPGRTDGIESSVLVAPTRRKLAADEARARAVSRVEAVVAAMCRWGKPGVDWVVGDSRFLILEFWPAKGDCLYVQIGTDPDGPVLIEACSGAWAPPARKYVRAPQRAALRAMGYEVGGRARNFTKDWAVAGSRDARALARELVDILVDVFGYRGRQPLLMHYCADGRAHPEPVFHGLVLEDVTRLLAIAGMTATPLIPQAPPASAGGARTPAAANPKGRRSLAALPRDLPRLLGVDGPCPFVIEMLSKGTSVPPIYGGLRLVSVLDDGAGLSDAEIGTLNGRLACGRIARDPSGQVVFALELWLGGVTVGWVVAMLGSWRRLRTRAARLVEQARRARRASLAPGIGGDEPDSDEDERPARRARTVVH